MRRWLILMWTALVASGACSGVALGSANHQGKLSPPPGSLSISGRPNPSGAGEPVYVAGRLSTPNRGGVTVVLWEGLPGAKSFHRVATTTTGPLGRYRFVRITDTARSWYATSRGLRSGTVTEQVHARVSLSSPDPYPVPGEASA